MDHAIAKRTVDEIDFSLDLPNFIFRKNKWSVSFFERPVLSNLRFLSDIVEASIRYYSSSQFVSFGAPGSSDYAQFFFDDVDFQQSCAFVKSGYNSFFDGTVGYPIILSNIDMDWIAYESSSEELGVFCTKIDLLSATSTPSLSDYLISCGDILPSSRRYSDLYANFGAVLEQLSLNYCENLAGAQP